MNNIINKLSNKNYWSYRKCHVCMCVSVAHMYLCMYACMCVQVQRMCLERCDSHIENPHAAPQNQCYLERRLTTLFPHWDSRGDSKRSRNREPQRYASHCTRRHNSKGKAQMESFEAKKVSSSSVI